MATKVIKKGPEYKYPSEMIKAALALGFVHRTVNGLKCEKCKSIKHVRKFMKGRATLYGCSKCGARWGSLIK